MTPSTMPAQTFLGLDVGTTHLKIAVIDHGTIRYQAYQSIMTYSQQNARYQRASEVLTICDHLIQSIPSKWHQQIHTIGFSVAMHSLMPVVNEQYDRIYLWSDQQAANWIANFKKTDIAQKFYLKTGTPIHAMSPFAKIGYFSAQHRYPANTRWLGLKELLMWYFTGQPELDWATASATGIWNSQQQTWDPEILDYLHLSKSQLAHVVAPTNIYAIKSSLAAQLQLAKNTQICIGASDGCLAAYAGYCASGITNSLTIGTSAAVRKLQTQITLDPVRQNFCYRLSDQLFVSGAPSNNGGSVLAWAQQNLARQPELFYQQLTPLLQQSPIGAQGIRFWPFINGERAPYWQANLKAQFKDLTLTQTHADLIRAVIEGMLFNIRTLTELVQVQKTLIISGGFFTNSTLTQMTADVLGLDLIKTAQAEPIFGLYDLLFPYQRQQPPQQVIHYRPERFQAYSRIFAHYWD